MPGVLSLLGLLIAVALTGSRSLGKPGPGATLGLLAISVLAFLSAAGALQQTRSIRILIVWFLGLVTFLASSALHRSGEGRSLVIALVLLGVILAGLGLYQALVSFPDAAGEVAATSGEEGRREEAIAARIRSGRAVATLGIPALLASILLLGIPLAASEAAASAGWARLGWGAAALVQVVGLAATRSLGGIAALAAGAAYVLLRRRGARWGRVAALVLILALLFAATAPRFISTGEGSASASLGFRTENWRAALSMLVAHPVLGVGPGNYGIAFPRHRTWESNETQHAHNSYLEITSDLGMAVLPLLLLVVAGLTRRAGELASRGENLRGGAAWRRPALAAALLAWLGWNLIDFGAYVGASLIPFMAVAGLVMAESGRRRTGSPAPAGSLAAGSLIAVAACSVLIAIPDSLARSRLEIGRVHAAAGEFRQAADQARLASLLNPYAPEGHGALAQALAAEAMQLPVESLVRRSLLAEAAVAATEAVRRDPHSAHRRSTLSLVRAASGDGAGAYAAMAAAARLNPFRPHYRRERDALLGILTGRPPTEDPEEAGP